MSIPSGSRRIPFADLDWIPFASVATSYGLVGATVCQGRTRLANIRNENRDPMGSKAWEDCKVVDCREFRVGKWYCPIRVSVRSFETAHAVRTSDNDKNNRSTTAMSIRDTVDQ